MDNSVVLAEIFDGKLPENLPKKIICKNCGGTKFRLRLNDRVTFSTHLSDEWLDKHGEEFGFMYEKYGDVQPDPACEFMGWNTSYLVQLGKFTVEALKEKKEDGNDAEN